MGQPKTTKAGKVLGTLILFCIFGGLIYGMAWAGDNPTPLHMDDGQTPQASEAPQATENVRANVPDETPLPGAGNSECWGDSSRQDISCRALTEKFLLSLRGATRQAVQLAMRVRGRNMVRGLHFISNYSKGERWGSGDVNFTFNENGRVSIIVASLDPPNSVGRIADFVWNAELLPQGCSDLPSTHMHRCDSL